jgi:Flp pilus assembly protein TadD
MIPSDDAIAALREALRVSPTNIPLHKHLAESLLELGRFQECETAYREALGIAPHNMELKLGLAGAYFQQQKNSPALVVIEDLLEQSDPPAEAYIWHAKLLMRAGEMQRAAYQYRQGVELDAAVGDAELARELGISSAGYDEDEVVDGRVRQRAGDLPQGPMELDIERSEDDVR